MLVFDTNSMMSFQSTCACIEYLISFVNEFIIPFILLIVVNFSLKNYLHNMIRH